MSLTVGSASSSSRSFDEVEHQALDRPRPEIAETVGCDAHREVPDLETASGRSRRPWPTVAFGPGPPGVEIWVMLSVAITRPSRTLTLATIVMDAERNGPSQITRTPSSRPTACGSSPSPTRSRT